MAAEQQLDVAQLVRDAVERTKDYLTPTPLEFSRYLSDQIKGEVWLKLDLVQRTASFKYRGAVNKVLSLTEEELDKGVVTASTGNYALAVAEAMRQRGRRATVYVAKDMDKSRLNILKSHGLDLVIFGDLAWDAGLEARRVGDEEGKIYVSPYNDPQIIGGQGTIGIELAEQLNDFDDTLITMGGGGLMSGIGTYLKKCKPMIRLVGCQPENSPEMTLSLKAGKIVELREEIETLSDGSAGGVEKGTITFPICQSVVDETVLVSEQEIESALKFVAHNHHKIIEGAAGVAVASLIKNKELYKERTVVIIICGSNIDIKKFKRII